MKQTAVEWLIDYLKNIKALPFIRQNLNINEQNILNDIIEQAKEMEKQQIMDSFVECWKANVPDGIECKLDAEQYYNETFKSE